LTPENGKEHKHKVDWDQLKSGLIGTRDKEFGQVAPYAHIVNTSMTADIWHSVLFAWLSLKGHLQGMHGLNRIELFAMADVDLVRATFITIWEHEEELAVWLKSGYTIEEMLDGLGASRDDIIVTLGRDFA